SAGADLPGRGDLARPLALRAPHAPLRAGRVRPQGGAGRRLHELRASPPRDDRRRRARLSAVVRLTTLASGSLRAALAASLGAALAQPNSADYARLRLA